MCERIRSSAWHKTSKQASWRHVHKAAASHQTFRMRTSVDVLQGGSISTTSTCQHRQYHWSQYASDHTLKHAAIHTSPACVTLTSTKVASTRLITLLHHVSTEVKTRSHLQYTPTQGFTMVLTSKPTASACVRCGLQRYTRIKQAKMTF